VPEGFRGPNVLEKLAAGAHDKDSHAENLAFLIEHVGHAMKAQDKKTRRLREEGGAQQPPRRRLEDEANKRVPSPGNDTPDGFCGSHAWALQQKPDGVMWEDASLPCADVADGGATEADGDCAGKYQYVTAFPDATEEEGVTFDYFIAWG
jgi:hypothetical protein